ncbi:MAG: GatB/YqeY domain-containing protein [Candidatus Omnitrophota bacterium]
MLLEDKILNDYKQAMKDRDALKSGALSFLRSQFMNARIEKRREKLDDIDAIAVIKKLIKQRQDSIEGFEAGNRQDLVDKETQEMEILKTYLPEEMSREAIEQVVSEVIVALGTTSMKDMGRVMKEVAAKTVGRADAKLTSEIVRNKLNG